MATRVGAGTRSVRLAREDPPGRCLAATAGSTTRSSSGPRIGCQEARIRAAREPASRTLAGEPMAHRSASAASRTRLTGCVSVHAKSTVPPDRAILG